MYQKSIKNTKGQIILDRFCICWKLGHFSIQQVIHKNELRNFTIGCIKSIPLKDTFCHSIFGAYILSIDEYEYWCELSILTQDEKLNHWLDRFPVIFFNLK